MSDADNVEGVQRLAKGLKDLSYVERLSKLGLRWKRSRKLGVQSQIHHRGLQRDLPSAFSPYTKAATTLRLRTFFILRKNSSFGPHF